MKKLFVILALVTGCGAPLVGGVQTGERISLSRADGSRWSAFENRQRGARRIWVGPEGQERPVTDGPYTDQDPSLIEQNGELLLAFASNRTGKWQVFVTRSADGKTWSAPEAVGEGLSPQIQADARQTVVAYEAWGGGIFVRELSWPEAKAVDQRGRFPHLVKAGDVFRLDFHTSTNQVTTLTSRDLVHWTPSL